MSGQLEFDYFYLVPVPVPVVQKVLRPALVCVYLFRRRQYVKFLFLPVNVLFAYLFLLVVVRELVKFGLNCRFLAKLVFNNL